MDNDVETSLEMYQFAEMEGIQQDKLDKINKIYYSSLSEIPL